MPNGCVVLRIPSRTKYRWATRRSTVVSTSAVISDIPQSLQQIGVVTGEVNPADCRNRIIRMTPTAAAEVGKFHNEYMRTLLPQFAALSTRERSELDRLLRKIHTQRNLISVVTRPQNRAAYHCPWIGQRLRPTPKCFRCARRFERPWSSSTNEVGPAPGRREQWTGVRDAGWQRGITGKDR